uniref:Transcription repressor n=1 Tax=Oryza brachyantha TaxID=4533 RepID=J3MP49_ORYBR
MPLPTSWFHRLRRKRSTARGDASDVEAATKTAPMAGALPPCSPNRASYYFPSRERRAAADNPKVRDTRFPRSPQPSDIVFDVVAVSSAADRFDGMKEMPELRLRPILTKRAAKKGGDGDEALDSGTSGAARRCRWLYESLLVVKESADPEEDFLESMAEMIAVNDVRSPRDLEELLACYLALNAAEHHRAIVGAFRRAWLHTATATATIANPITTK